MFLEIVIAVNQVLNLIWAIIGYSFAILGGIVVVLFMATPSPELLAASMATVGVIILRYIRRLVFQYLLHDQDNAVLIKLENEAVIQIASTTALLTVLLVFVFRLISFIF